MSHHLERHRLDNGLQVVLHRDAELPLVALNIWYHVGSKNERPGRTGFAHLFEHMLFQGSENVPENDHFRLVQQAGGVANGTTWYDRTNYYETLPSHCLELGLWLESDRMGFLLPAMTEEKLENQRSVVMNERRQRVDNQPYGRGFERLHELLYPDDHPYHWPVIGYLEDIEAATLEEVHTFFRTYYTPNNAVLTLAGDFEADEALQLVHRYFGPLAQGPPVPPPFGGGEPKLDRSQPAREILEDDVQLPRVYLAYSGPPHGDRDWFAAIVLATLLSEGRSSRLYHDLVYQRELAQSVAAYTLPTEECATFALVATGKPGSSPEALEAAMLEHLDAIGEQAPSEQEMERSRNHLLAGYYSDLQTLDQRADLLSHFTTFLDEPELVWSLSDRYTAVQADDLTRFVRHRCRPEQGARVLVVPRRGGAEPVARGPHK